MSITTINKANCKVLREDINTALASVLSKHGLVGSIGNITFEPGVELRSKLVVTQPATPNVLGASTPKVGEVWMFGNKKYTITSIVGTDVFASRPVRGIPRNYRLTAKNIAMMARVK